MALTTEQLISRLDDAALQLADSSQLANAPTDPQKQQYSDASSEINVVKAELQARKTCPES